MWLHIPEAYCDCPVGWTGPACLQHVATDACRQVNSSSVVAANMKLNSIVCVPHCYSSPLLALANSADPGTTWMLRHCHRAHPATSCSAVLAGPTLIATKAPLVSNVPQGTTWPLVMQAPAHRARRASPTTTALQQLPASPARIQSPTWASVAAGSVLGAGARTAAAASVVACVTAPALALAATCVSCRCNLPARLAR